MTSLSECMKHIEAMTLLLREETDQIRDGKLNDIDRNSKIKLHGLKQLQAYLSALTTPDQKKAVSPLLAALNKASVENGALLKGMYAGARSAQAKIKAIREQQSSVGVYGRKGQRINSSEAGVLTEKSV